MSLLGHTCTQYKDTICQRGHQQNMYVTDKHGVPFTTCFGSGGHGSGAPILVQNATLPTNMQMYRLDTNFSSIPGIITKVHDLCTTPADTPCDTSVAIPNIQ
eukprot:6742924-Ditylum_brightwellii.AAC.1